jgi:putative ABC transport system permease protein
MLVRLLRGATRLHTSRLALVVLSTAMGSGIAGALGAVSLQVGDRIAAELRSYGANLLVEPALPAAPADGPLAAAYLDEGDLGRVLTIFWRHNVVGLAPSLTALATVSAGGGPGERAVLAGVWFDRPVPRLDGGPPLRGGVAPLFPHWELVGRWPAEVGSAEAVLGKALAERLGVGPGGSITLRAGAASVALPVAGVVRAGGFEDEQVMIPLASVQALLGRPRAVSRALVSAVTVPLDAFGRRDPSGLTPRELEKWFCTPYVTSVARQLQDAVPGSRARPVWSMAEAEARVLQRTNVLMALLAALTLAAAALAVASTFAARVMGRRTEIALMRATGASAAQIALLLGTEILALALAGGLAGSGLAFALVRLLGVAVFSAPLSPGLAVIPLSLAGSLAVAAAGAAWPIRRALAVEPAQELRESAA